MHVLFMYLRHFHDNSLEVKVTGEFTLVFFFFFHFDLMVFVRNV
jgi:hypothetical protein